MILTNTPLYDIVEHWLQTVYDPDFPLIDIWTLWLIYNISIDEWSETIDILMTLTTPACPHGEMIQQMIITTLAWIIPTYDVSLEITYDPMRSIAMIKDEDLKRMFE